jgi:hypothetical protein
MPNAAARDLPISDSRAGIARSTKKNVSVPRVYSISPSP